MKPKPLIAIILIFWLATGLRFYRLDAQSFWNDEGNSARLSERSIPAIIEGTASDIHPPLYYLILRGWRELVGETEFGLRSFSAFAGVLTVAVTFALAKDIEDRARGRKSPLSLALTASFLTAVSPPLIYYSQETRMYALLALLGVLSTWLFLRWQSSAFSFQSSTFFYLLSIIAGLYTHYFFAAVLITHNLLILVWLLYKRRGAGEQGGRGGTLPRAPAPFLPFFKWMVIMLAAALAYLPWLPVFINQTGGRPGGVRPSFWAFLLDVGRWLALGATIEAETAVPYLIAAIVLVIGGIIMRRSWTTDRIAAVTLLLIPVLFMFAAGTTQPEFFKFMLVAVPFWSLLIASSFNRKVFSFASSALFAVSFLLLLVGNGRSLQNLYFNPNYARADYRGMVARIAAEAHPNAGIILDAPNQWEAFTYYHRDGAPVYPIPRGYPNPVNIAAELTAIADQHDRIYAIFWGEAQRDPERLVERWLDEHAFKATDEWIRDVRFVTYAVPSKPAAEMTTAVSIPFGSAITLNGYTLVSDELAPGDIVQITLFWETAVPLSTRYKIFLHLLDENGNLIAQRDTEPGGGLNLTTNWEPGQPVMDNHGVLIPADTPPGVYQIRLGLYDIADPAARLSVQMGTAVTDTFLIATILISQ